MKTMVFTDCDLAGCGTYLVYKWFTGHTGPVEICSQSNFKKTFTAWSRKNDLNEFDNVLIFDIDVSTDANRELIDKPNVIVIDHHDTHIANKDKYQHAKTILQNCTSCCKLVYKIFKEKYKKVKLTDTQKLLMLLVDDYDSYELKLPDSYKLNVVLWNYKGKRLEQFMRDFTAGFTGFNQSHKNIIHLNQKKVDRLISELEVYVGTLPTAKKKLKLAATFCTESLNEIAHHVLENYDCDICMVVNMNTKRVSFRKNKERIPEFDLGNLASKIADGGGHKDSAGGSLNENVMAISKMLTIA